MEKFTSKTDNYGIRHAKLHCLLSQERPTFMREGGTPKRKELHDRTPKRKKLHDRTPNTRIYSTRAWHQLLIVCGALML